MSDNFKNEVDISQRNTNVNFMVVPDKKSRSPKLVGFIHRGPQMSIQYFMAIHSIVVEIVIAFWTNQRTMYRSVYKEFSSKLSYISCEQILEFKICVNI